MSFTLIQHGSLYTPQPLGKGSLLIIGEKIVKIGTIEADPLLRLGIPVEVIDAAGQLVIPGFIDPHAHLIGAGGEQGFTSRMPELSLAQLVEAGVTTVVGVLGSDTTTRPLPSLYAKARQLSDEGITTYMYTGGFEVPARTMTTSLMDDVVLIDKIIGVGEIAISDSRWADPPLAELAKVVAEANLGGMIGGKAGVAHFHLGSGRRGMSLLNELLDNYEIPPASIYATHITRTPALLDEAIALARRGAYVDMDTVEAGLGKHVRYYLDHEGPPDHLTVSSDAHTPGGSPGKLYREFVSAVHDHNFTLAEILPFFTSNPAQVLKLGSKGALQEEKDADLLIVHPETLEIMHVFARGRQFIRDGQLVTKSRQEEQVNESTG